MNSHLALPGPDNILRQVLPNGIVVLARENWSAPSVVVEGYLLAGSLDEPAELMGLASFTSGMLSRGTHKRSFAEISELVEGVGASIGFSADRLVTSFSAKSLVEDLDLVLGVLADELRNPAFPAEHVEKVRGLRMTAIAERENDTRQMAGLALRETLFESHPLARNLLGNRQSNASITRDRLIHFYQTFYQPRDMVVVVVGAVEATTAVAKVKAALGDWTGTRPPIVDLPPVPPVTEVRQRRVSMPDKTQTDIMIGWPAMHRLHADFDAARVANTVLGVFGMMGRLGANVRERQGMAYYAFSRLNADRYGGTWSVVAGVHPSNVERTIQAVLEEVRRLCDDLVPEDELDDTRRYLTGSLPLQLETNDGVASLLSDLEWHRLGLDYVLRYRDIINSLTPAALQAAACKYLNPNAYASGVAGP